MIRKRPSFTTSPKAFTLIELLVVVSIIALLIGILVPTLQNARNVAKESASKLQLHQIANAVETYYNDFGSYPGVIDDKQFTSTSTFSGAQNLCLTLTRRFYPGNQSTFPTGSTQVPLLTVGTQTVLFDTNPGLQLANYSPSTKLGALTESLGTTKFNLHDSYYATSAGSGGAQRSKELSTGNISNIGSLDLQALPCFIDYSFGTQAMPILYYRRNYKYNPDYATQTPPRPGFATDIVGLDNTAPTTARFSFYAATNIPIAPTMDVPMLQNGYLQTIPTGQPNAPGAPVGEFVLIAADRTRAYSSKIMEVGGR